MPELTSFGLSDIGVTRPNNEDVWAALPEVGFFALADGMGGHQAGEIAAKETIDFLSQTAKEIKSRDIMEIIIEIRHAIEKANRRVHKLGSQSQELHGMGTTLCCLIWTDEAIIYAHVGDSRIYRLRQNKLELLTQDHSFFAKWLKLGKLAEECQTPYPYKNVITRAIGGPGKANPEIAVAAHQAGDLYFLCSDGLSDVLSIKEMERILNRSPTLSLAAERLVEMAKIKGSSDNMTILMIQSETDGKNLLGQQCDDGPGSESIQSDALRPERPSSEPI